MLLSRILKVIYRVNSQLTSLKMPSINKIGKPRCQNIFLFIVDLFCFKKVQSITYFKHFCQFPFPKKVTFLLSVQKVKTIYLKFLGYK